MKLTILGCNGPYPGNGGACSGYLLASDSENTKLLIDLGSGALSILPAFCDYGEIDAVILTHLHFDHMSDMLPLCYAYQFNPRTQPLSVYAPKSPADVAALLKMPCYELHDITDTRIGEFDIRFMRVRHPVECYAVRVTEGERSFVFTGDTNECPGLSAFCAGADLLMADAAFAESDWSYEKPHLSALRCGYLACAAGVKHLLLTHFNPNAEPVLRRAEAMTVFPNTDVAVIGKTYTI